MTSADTATPDAPGADAAARADQGRPSAPLYTEAGTNPACQPPLQRTGTQAAPAAEAAAEPAAQAGRPAPRNTLPVVIDTPAAGRETIADRLRRRADRHRRSTWVRQTMLDGADRLDRANARADRLSSARPRTGLALTERVPGGDRTIAATAIVAVSAGLLLALRARTRRKVIIVRVRTVETLANPVPQPLTPRAATPQVATPKPELPPITPAGSRPAPLADRIPEPPVARDLRLHPEPLSPPTIR